MAGRDRRSSVETTSPIALCSRRWYWPASNGPPPLTRRYQRNTSPELTTPASSRRSAIWDGRRPPRDVEGDLLARRPRRVDLAPHPEAAGGHGDQEHRHPHPHDRQPPPHPPARAGRGLPGQLVGRARAIVLVEEHGAILVARWRSPDQGFHPARVMRLHLRRSDARPVNAAVLPSWHEGPAKAAVIDFVSRTCGLDGTTPLPVEERVAVFDNDGTLWCEKPMPIQLDFILRRMAEMAFAQPDLPRASRGRPSSSATSAGSGG